MKLSSLALATALCAPILFVKVGPASAAEINNQLLARLADVDTAVKGAPPKFGCYDPTDKTSCQQDREAFAATAGSGWFYSADFSDGSRARCYAPQSDAPTYRVCQENYGGIDVEIRAGHRWITARLDDRRCQPWSADPFTVEYMACVAALPPLS
jgi:hypothetical protein